MTLTADQLQLAIFCAHEERQARHRGKPPGPQAWNDQLIEALCRELAALSASPSRQSEVVGLRELQREDSIGSGDAAVLLGWNLRRVQRHAGRLGGRRISGKLVFQRSTILEHCEGAA